MHQPQLKGHVRDQASELRHREIRWLRDHGTRVHYSSGYPVKKDDKYPPSARGPVDADWSGAHALHLAQPSVEWPRGRPVVTVAPVRYRGAGVRVIRIEV
ncbi:hypothetical protein OIE62_22885 [Streptomyces scopuliridis]|uniref:Uncharacterized protein n=1 Tax=Streptomyces scopuliridis TaxID=452529 RepID=A0ACD4ZYX4_9ACTN|nr:hypothetical protein [Streptomyces scopuliridis]WSB38982.1 hypothetical protein OG949_17515 [Streptomyces scopuliridis]WSC03430.1 hypothetical protein OG835_18060 [Streptomyces scopuliridis]WSC11274.1 hypothetical protein OIE62_22885 [Streptomyces scopuliridis]